MSHGDFAMTEGSNSLCNINFCNIPPPPPPPNTTHTPAADDPASAFTQYY